MQRWGFQGRENFLGFYSSARSPFLVPLPPLLSISHTRINTITRTHTPKSAKRKSHPHLSLSHHLFFSCKLSRCISFSVVTELSVQVISGFDPKTDQICHRKQLVKEVRCSSQTVMFNRYRPFTPYVCVCVCAFYYLHVCLCALHTSDCVCVCVCVFCVLGDMNALANSSHSQHLCSHSDLRCQSQLKQHVLASPRNTNTHAEQDPCRVCPLTNVSSKGLQQACLFMGLKRMGLYPWILHPIVSRHHGSLQSTVESWDDLLELHSVWMTSWVTGNGMMSRCKCNTRAQLIYQVTWASDI